MKPQLYIFNQCPFLRFTLVFIFGITLENIVNPILNYLITILLIILAILIVYSITLKNSIVNDRLFSVLILTTFLTAGFIYSQTYKQLQYTCEIPVNGIYSGIVREKVPSTNNRYKYTLKLESATENENIHLIDEKILLYSSDSSANAKIEPGCEIYFGAHLFEISNNNNPGEFNFKRYMNRKGVRYQAYVKENIVISKAKRYGLLTTALNIRTKLMNLYHDAGINGDEYAVLGALTLGDQNYISNEVKSYFSSSGAMHVLSVSGLHIAIIFVVLEFLLRPLNKRKKLKGVKVVLLLGFLWIYAFITGLAPCVLRSTSMFSFLVIAQNFNKRTNAYNTLAVSAFLLLLLNPLNLFDVGFQLSYLAVFSILFFQPHLSSLYNPKNAVSKYISELVTVSIAAQVGTTPVCIFYFNQFPTYFLLSNLIVVPAAAIILYLGMLFFAVSFIPYLSDGIAFALKYLTMGLNYSVKTVEALPGSVIEGITISLLAVGLLYLLIVSFSYYLIAKRSNPLLLSLSTFALLLLLNISSWIKSATQERIIIYNNRTTPLISYIDGKNHYYWSASDSLVRYSKEMLKGASEKYRTYKPVDIEGNNTTKSQQFQKSLTIKGIPIAIISNKLTTDSMFQKNTVIYFPNKSLIRINPSDKFKIESNKNDSIVLNDRQKITRFNLKKSGALILNLN
jgi:competence protein ComEC